MCEPTTYFSPLPNSLIVLEIKGTGYMPRVLSKDDM